MNGMLQHEYGVAPQDIHWFIGGLAAPTAQPLIPLNLSKIMKVDFLVRGPGAGEDVGGRRGGRTVCSPNPVDLSEGVTTRFTRLFPNYKEVEQDSYRRTRIFPIMHTVVIRDDVYREHPVGGSQHL